MDNKDVVKVSITARGVVEVAIMVSSKSRETVFCRLDDVECQRRPNRIKIKISNILFNQAAY
jgi:hypothetical protein